MSGPRVSRRVLEKEAQLREQQEKQEALALKAVQDNIRTFYSALGTAYKAEDFELPSEYLRPERPKRSRRTNVDEVDDDDGAESENLEEEQGIPIPRYRVLKQNLYRPPLSRSVASPEDCPTCDCKPDIGCGAGCHNRLVFMECAPGECPSHTTLQFCQPIISNGDSAQSLRSGSSRAASRATIVSADVDLNDGSDAEDEVLYCANTAIQTKTFPAVQVFPTIDITSPPPPPPPPPPVESAVSKNKRRRGEQHTQEEPAHVSRGFGLKLLEPVRRGTIIIEYLGEVITSAEGLRRMQEYVLGDDFYFAGLDGGLMLDAKTMGSPARFANHSCAPTCILQKWTVLGECRLVLVAKKDLAVGSEITYNYNYFDDSLEGMRGMQRQKCLCGAAHCSGTIGGRVSKHKHTPTTTSASQAQCMQRNARVNRGACRSGRVTEKNADLSADSDSDEEGVEDLWERCQDLLPLLCDNAMVDIEVTKGESVDTDALLKETVRGDTVVYAESSTMSDSTTKKIPHFMSKSTKSAIKKYTPEVLSRLVTDIQACTQRASALNGGAPVVSSRFIANTDDIVTRLAQVSTQLNTMLQDGSGWCAEYDALLGGDIVDCDRLIDLSQALSLLSSAPNCVKLEQATQLEMLVRNATKAQRTVENVLHKIRPAAGASNNQVPTHSGGVHFDELIDAFRALEAALPLNCGNKNLVNLLGHYEAFALWARQHVSPVAMPYMRAEGGREGVIADLRSEEAEQIGCLQRVVSAYLVRNQPKSGPADGVVMPVLKAEPAAAPITLHGPVMLSSMLPLHPGGTDQMSTGVTVKAEPGTIVDKVIASKVPHNITKRSTPAQRSSIPAVSLVLPLLSDPFWIAQWLDSRLCTYMEKLAIEDDLQPSNALGRTSEATAQDFVSLAPQPGINSVEKSLEVIVAKINDSISSAPLAQTSDPKGRKDSAHQPKVGEYDVADDASSDNEGVLFCFCRLPEENGECDILSECSICLNWFHPPCINAAGLTLSAASRNKAFFCPVCMHLSNQLGNFSRSPQEWKFIKPARPTRTRESHALSGSVVKQSKQDAKKVVSKVRSEPAAGACSSSTLVGEDGQGAEGDVGAKRKRAYVPAPGAPRPTDKNSVFIKGALLAGGTVKVKPAAAVKVADYLTVSELEELLQMEHKQPITRSPLSLLFNLARKYVLGWQQECAAFLSSDSVRSTLQRTSALLLQPPSAAGNGNGEGTHASMVSVREIVREGRVLQRCMELYLQLRVVRIRGRECTSLRQLAWIITTSTLLRGVSASLKSVMLPDDRMPLLFERHIPTPDELYSLIAAGCELFSVQASELESALSLTLAEDMPSMICQVGKQLLRHHSAVYSAYAQLQVRAIACASRDAARSLVPAVDAFLAAKSLCLEGGEFWVARVKCLERDVPEKIAHPTELAEEALHKGNSTSMVSMSMDCITTIASEGGADVTANASCSSDGGTAMDNVSGVHSQSLTSIATLTSSSSVTPELQREPTSMNAIAAPGEANQGIERTAEAPQVTAYCWCRQGDDGTPMVCCDGCEEWFHCRCVGLSSAGAVHMPAKKASKSASSASNNNRRTKKAAKADLAEESAYWCISCTHLSGQSYPFAW